MSEFCKTILIYNVIIYKINIGFMIDLNILKQKNKK